MAEYKFKIFKSSRNSQFYFNFIAPNNQIMAQSEGYISKQSAKDAIATIKAYAGSAKVYDDTAAANALRW